MTLKELLRQTYDNLLILQEREAKYGGNAPIELLNQIADHHQAINLINQSLSTEVTETELKALKAALKPLLIGKIDELNLDELKRDTPLLPFEPATVLIPTGSFLMGSDADDLYEAPQHPVTLPGYRIGLYPVTNAQYAEFIKREKQHEPPKKAGWFLREPPADKLDHPVVGLSWEETLAYCRWLSQQTGRTYRLPTEAEWEKAASWAEGHKRRYPWGDKWQSGCCNGGSDETTPVSAYPAGMSFYGCYDMLGNAQEWTTSLWGSDPQVCAFPYPYLATDGREDPIAGHLHRVYRVHRGGSFRDDPAKLRCSARGCSTPDSKIRWRGFRVVIEL